MSRQVRLRRSESNIQFKDPLQVLLLSGEARFLEIYHDFNPEEIKKAVVSYIFAYAFVQFEEKNTLNPEDILPLEFLQKLKDRGLYLSVEDIQAQKKVCDVLARLYDDEDKAEPHYKVYKAVSDYLIKFFDTKFDTKEERGNLNEVVIH